MKLLAFVAFATMLKRISAQKKPALAFFEELKRRNVFRVVIGTFAGLPGFTEPAVGLFD